MSVPEQMHICVQCGSPLVQPIEWSEEGPLGWLVVLRCPECELSRPGVFGQNAIDAFDDELDRGTQILQQELAALTRDNMTEYATDFIGALAAGHIEPIDF